MRFKFCGDIEPPEWFFSEVNQLSRLNSVRIKLISLQIAKKIANQEFDLQKAWKMCGDSGLSKEEVQSALAAIHFIFTSACKFDVSAEMLSVEIAQLGLPQENAVSLSKVYGENLVAMSSYLSHSFLRSICYIVNEFENLTWKVDYDLVTQNTIASLKIKTNKFEVPVVTSLSQITLLSQELERAKGVMEKLLVRE
ncbi:hypothetical protein SteCoe_10080 [Stentor coeruleus]|uniref:COMM domain-containing protein n=1 Tax=Stentor coeruleus TaxID=5963 RepID=A0A1R2CGL8_9CILI|nr:hypothetical protein SteCoe_10080 [Stentor coeruleus]